MEKKKWRMVVSLSNKTGIIPFVQGLSEIFDLHVLSTGGTAKVLLEAGILVQEVSDYTGFPEMLDGRVKTLHPKVHGGLLGIRSNPEHVKKMEEYGILPINMLVVNLYPFEATIAKTGCTLDQAVENIDIGGPAMLRAAAKNYPHVVVLSDKADYLWVLNSLKKTGDITRQERLILAAKLYQRTSDYDRAIANYLRNQVDTTII